jgi:hypothetical protein
MHPDTLASRELGRAPEPKLLPSESRAYREQGIVSETMQQVLDIRAQRAHQAEVEQATTRVYWSGRKVELGIEHAMSHSERLEHIRKARTHTMSHAPERATLGQLREQTRDLEHSVRGLEKYVADLGHEHRMETFFAQRGVERDMHGQ